MKDFVRNDHIFSLCGLNCGLCSMHLGGHCPGCGGGAGNQPCAIARCSIQHEKIEYCFECAEFPCSKYDGITDYDSFITHRNQLKDLEKAKSIGLEAYHGEQAEKVKILKTLLEDYNDGRKKTFYCLAVNLLELEEIKSVMEQIENETSSANITSKEKAAIAVKLFEAVADKQGIVLKLNKKSNK